MEPNQSPGQQPIVPPAGSPAPKRQFNFNFPAVMVIVGIIVVLALAGLLIYFVSQANQTQTQIDKQINAAVDQAKAEQQQADEAAFTEREKQPFRIYEAPAVLGAIKVEFPKNWNVYAVEEEKASTQLDVFMYPGVVRAEKSTTEPYAFRLVLEQKLYTDTIKKYQSRVEDGELTATATSVSGIAGTRFDGEIDDGRTGSIILLPVRDKTLLIWTEAPAYLGDYNQIIEKLSITP